jgi:hypothetical protein
MMISLILAMSIPNISWLEKRQEMAYIMGRCDNWLDAEFRSQVQRHFDEIDSRLWLLYVDGLRDSRKEPLNRATCVKVINDLHTEMNTSS